MRARVHVYAISYIVYTLENYTIVYTNMAAVTKFIAKDNKTTTLASKNMTFWRLYIYKFRVQVYKITR